jgi:hypothetical protein
MMGPQNILDPFGGGPPNPNKVPKWVAGPIVAGLAGTAIQQIFDPADPLKVIDDFMNPRQNQTNTANQQVRQNISRASVGPQYSTGSQSGGGAGGGSRLQSLLSQLSAVLTQLSQALSGKK